MIEQNTDILIVGGGPAGSTTALYLARLGFNITIIEKKKFPRETLCGEFLSKEVTDVLKDLNFYEDFISLEPNKLNSFRAVDESGVELKSDLNFDAFGMKRSVFDSFLLEKAKSPNVFIHQPAEVISIIKTKSGFTSEIVNETSSKYQINSKLVIAAYGKQNVLDKKLERDFINKKTYLNGIKIHLPVELLNESFSDEIRIYTNDGLYCGMNQVNKSEMTVCFLENRKYSKIPSRDRFLGLLKSNAQFKNLFNQEAQEYIKSTNIYGTGNIFFGKRKVVENGIIMIGDAARVISPLAGDGIGMAMESAKLFYSIIKQIGISDTEKLYSEYERRYEKVFSKRLKTARVVQSLILNKRLRKPAFIAASFNNAILSGLIKFTRSK